MREALALCLAMGLLVACGGGGGGGSSTPEPEVVPTAIGGLQVEWHRNGLDLEIQFHPDGRIRAWAEEESSGVDWEGEITRDASAVIPYFNRLRSIRIDDKTITLEYAVPRRSARVGRQSYPQCERQ